MPTPSIQTLRADAQQVLNLDSISAVRSVVAATLANANAGTPLNPNLTTQQLWNEFYQIVTQPKSDIESIIANQLMKFLYAPPAPGGAGADKQVIFNDGGVLAGDPQFLWNKTTNLLTVTGAATISGDLTVDTNVLKVNSANDRVGIGTASPTSKLHVFGSGTNTFLTISDVGANYNIALGTQNADIAQLAIFNTTIASGSKDFWLTALSHTFNTWNGSAYSNRFVIASDGVATWSNVGGVAGTAMTLNANGLGIGVTPSAWFSTWKVLQLAGGSFGGPSDRSFWLQNAIVNPGGNFQYVSGSSTPASGYRQFNGAHDWYTAAAGTSPNTITDFSSPKMTLDASGNLFLGAATATAQGRQEITYDGSTLQGLNVIDSSATATATAVSFIKSSGTRGNILVTATGTTYNTVSDYRLKESVKPLVGGIARVSALKPSIYKWKIDGSNGEGFLAHELAEVVPAAVTGEKDAVNEDGSIKAQGVDLSKVVPILVAAIQELAAEVNALKNA